MFIPSGAVFQAHVTGFGIEAHYDTYPDVILYSVLDIGYSDVNNNQIVLGVKGLEIPISFFSFSEVPGTQNMHNEIIRILQQQMENHPEVLENINKELKWLKESGMSSDEAEEYKRWTYDIIQINPGYEKVLVCSYLGMDSIQISSVFLLGGRYEFISS